MAKEKKEKKEHAGKKAKGGKGGKHSLKLIGSKVMGASDMKHGGKK